MSNGIPNGIGHGRGNSLSTESCVLSPVGHPWRNRHQEQPENSRPALGRLMDGGYAARGGGGR